MMVRYSTDIDQAARRPYLRTQSPTMPLPPRQRAVAPVRIAALVPPLHSADTSASFASHVKLSPVVSNGRRPAAAPGAPAGPAGPTVPASPRAPAGPRGPARPPRPLAP